MQRVIAEVEEASSPPGASPLTLRRLVILVVLSSGRIERVGKLAGMRVRPRAELGMEFLAA